MGLILVLLIIYIIKCLKRGLKYKELSVPVSWFYTTQEKPTQASLWGPLGGLSMLALSYHPTVLKIKMCIFQNIPISGTILERL